MRIRGQDHAYGLPSSQPTLGQASMPQGLESFNQSVNRYVLKPCDVPSTMLSTGEEETGVVLCLRRGRQVLNR